MIFRQVVFIFSCLAFLISQVDGARAMDLGTDKLRLSGFGTLGVISSGNKKLQYRGDISQEPIDDDEVSLRSGTVLGLQLDGTMTEALSTSMQVVLRDNDDYTLTDYVQRCFLRYKDDIFMVRLGRLGLDMYMLSEYGNVGFAYLWANPPMEFYSYLPFDNFDGMDFSYTLSLAGGSLQTRFFGGKSKKELFSRYGSTSIKLNPMLGTTLVWEKDEWTTRFGAVCIKSSTSSDATDALIAALRQGAMLGWSEANDIAEDIEDKEKIMHYYFSAGMAYEGTKWLVQSEVGYFTSEYGDYHTTLNGYFSLGYIIRPVTLFTMVGHARSLQPRKVIDSAPQGLEPLQAGAQEFYDQARFDQTSLSFGARWDILPKLALKAQWDHTWIGKYGAALWFKDVTPSNSQEINTFTLNLNFMF